MLVRAIGMAPATRSSATAGASAGAMRSRVAAMPAVGDVELLLHRERETGRTPTSSPRASASSARRALSSARPAPW
jgi:hypothetical protein